MEAFVMKNLVPLLILAALGAAGMYIAATTATVSATPGQTSSCNSCHALSSTLKISTGSPTVSVQAGQSFPVAISWSGAVNGNRTEVNWPNTQSNTLFNPSPRIPFSSATSSGAGTASSTLIAPSTPGTYTVRVFAAYGIPSPQTVYADVVVTVAAASTAPVLTQIGNKTVGVGQLLQFAISATDLKGGTLTYSASNLPSGAAFNASTRAFSWTPSQAGTYPATFRVSNGSASASETINITVTAQSPVNGPPLLSRIGNKTGIVGQLLQFSVTATDSNGDNLTYSAANLPTGASFNTLTRTFAWTPQLAGTYPNVVILVSDGSATASENITISVSAAAQANAPPVMSPIGDRNVTVGETLAFSLNASDPNGDNLTYTATELPSGATFSAASRTFSWQSKAAGKYAVAFQVSDGSLTASQSVNIMVTMPIDEPPVLSPMTNQSVRAGTLLMFSLSATDANGDALLFSASNLPRGAIFDANSRTFSWTPRPEQLGRYPFVHFEVSDGTFTKSSDISIVVLRADQPVQDITSNVAPVLDPVVETVATGGQLLQFMLTASDANCDDLTFKASNLPAGSSFNPLTRVFAWRPTPQQVGVHKNVLFEVTDGELSAAQSVDITVNGADTAGPGIHSVETSAVKPTSAVIRWTTDEPSTSQVEYWSGTGQLSLRDDSPVTGHSVPLAGLKPGATYRFRTRSVDKSGNLSRSGEFKFTTLPDFSVTSLTVNPREVGLGKPFTVQALVTNNLDVRGSYEVAMRVGDALESATTVDLAAGEQRLVSFSSTRYAAGASVIDVGGSRGTLIVLPSDGTESNHAATVGLIAAPLVGACSAGIWIYRRRRSIGGKDHGQPEENAEQ
jgi:hypothetical protein